MSQQLFPSVNSPCVYMRQIMNLLIQAASEPFDIFDDEKVENFEITFNHFLGFFRHSNSNNINQYITLYATMGLIEADFNPIQLTQFCDHCLNHLRSIQISLLKEYIEFFFNVVKSLINRFNYAAKPESSQVIQQTGYSCER